MDRCHKGSHFILWTALAGFITGCGSAQQQSVSRTAAPAADALLERPAGDDHTVSGDVDLDLSVTFVDFLIIANNFGLSEVTHTLSLIHISEPTRPY